jgi:hypothetical protein
MHIGAEIHMVYTYEWQYLGSLRPILLNNLIPDGKTLPPEPKQAVGRPRVKRFRRDTIRTQIRKDSRKTTESRKTTGKARAKKVAIDLSSDDSSDSESINSEDVIRLDEEERVFRIEHGLPPALPAVSPPKCLKGILKKRKTTSSKPTSSSKRPRMETPAPDPTRSRATTPARSIRRMRCSHCNAWSGLCKCMRSSPLLEPSSPCDFITASEGEEEANVL